MAADFKVPQEVSDMLASLDAAAGQIDEYAVQGLIAGIANALGKLPDADRRGLAAESIAFNFVGQNGQTSMWGTHFGPMMTGEDNNGKFVCVPDIHQVDPTAIHYWVQRAATVTHPVLKARYADLAWDLTRATGEKPDVEMARWAIDAYLAAAAPQYRDGLHARLTSAIRAFDLAMKIKDVARIADARTTILDLHAEAIANNAQVWWLAPNRLLRDNRAGMSAAEAAALIKTLEELVVLFGDIGNPGRFDPNALEQAAGLLQKRYRRHGTAAEIKRLHEAVARGYEAGARIADAMVASSFLQSAVNAYGAAGMKDEVKRVRILMQAAIQNSNKAMKSISTQVEIKKDDVDAFLAAILDDDPGMTLAKIANEFLSSKTALETQLQGTAKAAPLQAMIPMQIMQDDHVAATIGSIKEDPVGRLVHQVDMNFSFSALWLMTALDGATEKHDLTPDHFAGWSNRVGLFEDTNFLKEGFAAWFDEDYVKALHVLVPQAERGLRAIAASVGVPVTKPHPVTQNASMSISMGDILANEKVLAAIGEDIALHFRALYSDPRGMNLRNRVAHGIYSPQSLNPHIVRLVVHSLLVLGIWQDLVKVRTKAKP